MAGRSASIRLNGIIASASGPVPRSVINLQAVESALVRAFEAENAVAVALVINSPGGSPTQSQLIADRIRGLAAEHELPVLAFCEDVAASGGYWLACAADEIFACRTSLVGSIGVVSGGFGLTGLIERFGIERRLHTAGANKARLDPFQPEKPEDVEWLLGMQGELHELFIEWVRSRRGNALDESADLYTGEVWTGRRARGARADRRDRDPARGAHGALPGRRAGRCRAPQAAAGPARRGGARRCARARRVRGRPGCRRRRRPRVARAPRPLEPFRPVRCASGPVSRNGGYGNR